jgi:hypothetical protein
MPILTDEAYHHFVDDPAYDTAALTTSVNFWHLTPGSALRTSS